MRRIVARFDDSEHLENAKNALREADFDPTEPDIENPFFDPSTSMPEGKGMLWGGILGGVIGALLLFALNQNAFWIPRISPIMTAGRYMLVFLGLGVGAAIGVFFGGVIGTYKRVPNQDEPRIAVLVPEQRIDDVTELLRHNDATVVDDAVAYHDHPLRTQTAQTPADKGSS